jgi:hypothetical protein
VQISCIRDLLAIKTGMPPSKSPPLTALYRDLAAGLHQQMYFWGKDAEHSEGNLFLRTGFQKRPSTGLKGTSCYRLPWRNGAIELHGSHAGWLSEEGGMLFIRPLRRCVRWCGATPPVPGKYPRDCFSARTDELLQRLTRPFLDWWLAHEKEVQRLTSGTYRESCHRLFKKLPRSRAWLRPESATRWVIGLRDCPAELPRARRFEEAR